MSEVITIPTTVWTDRFIKRELLPAGELARRFNILNPRLHPENQRDAVEESLETLGWIDEPSLSTNGPKSANLADNPDAVLKDGHLRIELALLRGGEDALVPVNWYFLTEKETELSLNIQDPTSEMAVYDPDKLAALLARTREMMADRPGLGAMLERLKERAGINGNGQPAPEPTMPTETEAERLAKEWQTAPGQVWQLGRHIIACLDSTDEAAVRELIGGKAVGMVWADPPYGIDIVSDEGKVGTNSVIGRGVGYAFGGVKNNTEGRHGIPTGVYAKVIGDETPETALKAFKICQDLGRVGIWWGANYYANELPVSRHWIVWDKQTDGNLFADAELAWTNQQGATRMFRHTWNGMLKASEQGQRRIHPTQKPVALPVWCFSEYGKPEDLIFDPFLGSGISVLAAEKLNDGRRVIGCELAHEYIAVVLHRWQQMTGQTPRRVSG